MNKALKTKVLYEITQIDKLLDKAAPLLNLCNARDPDFIEMSAMAAVLHSLYSGIESIFLMVDKEKNRSDLNSAGWHKELLNRAANELNLISLESRDVLAEYMQFRHFFRHAYNFQMNWMKMKHLALGSELIWGQVKKEVQSYLESEEDNK